MPAQSPIFLIGFMASGKSEVAQALANRLSMPCIDLDTSIEADAGMTITEIFSAEGESGFRARESRALHSLIRDQQASDVPSIVATGGGTACFSDNLNRMKQAGTVVHLATELSTARSRASGSEEVRPLLSLDTDALTALYRKRDPIYRRAHLSVSTEERSSQNVAHDIDVALRAAALPTSIQTRFGATTSIVALQERSYPIVVETGCLDALGEVFIGKLPTASRVGIVSDDHVFPLYGARVIKSLEDAGVSVVTEIVAAGEQSKEIGVFSTVCESLIRQGLDRNSAIIALGGGVVGDLAGFVAASLFRGIPVVQVPTTLLSMTDSAIGGKTGINSRQGKNLIGAFWQPVFVWADPETLITLAVRERRAAFGELVKYALLDEAIWPLVESMASTIAGEGPLIVSENLTKMVRDCAAFKAAVVSVDERERGLRATLNLGHTVGHAIESAAGYGKLLHGEAVALGLLAACRLSYALGLCSEELASEVETILKNAGLHTDLSHWLRDDVLAGMAVDKKRTGGTLRFIVVAKPGDVRRHKIELSELTRLLLAE